MNIYQDIITEQRHVSGLSNLVFANPVHISYNPFLPTRRGIKIDPFAKQPDNYAWCSIAFEKIVLRDVYEKYNGRREAIPGNIQFQEIEDLITQARSPIDVDNSIMKWLLLKKKVDTDDDPEFVDGEKENFDRALDVFFEGLVGHFNQACLEYYATAERDDDGRPTNGCDNPLLCVELSKDAAQRRDEPEANVKFLDEAKYRLFRGLLWLAPEEKLMELWDNGLQGNLKRCIKASSDKDEINVINEKTGIGGQITRFPEDRAKSGANEILKTILTEIRNCRAVILSFRENKRDGALHCCVAYAGEYSSSRKVLEKDESICV
jgi:hypothetical protein